jgi:hypothetical protein
MRLEDYPNLLILNKLVAPIELSTKKLRDISAHIEDSNHDVVVHGLFVMAVSSMEVMLSDVLEYFLVSFPMKLPNNDFKFEKEIFFDYYFALLKKTAETHITGLSYKSFEDYFKKAIDYFSIEWPDFFEVIGNDIKEIRATRNLLLHNNLILNDQYRSTAGIKKRGGSGRIKVDKPYLKQTIVIFLSFEEQLRLKLSEKYKEYTKINANKRLWKFLFTTPVMPYDHFWDYDEKTDTIYALKKGKYEEQLSNSETLLLSLWRTQFQFCKFNEHMVHFNMLHFDSHNKEKILFFLSIASDFPFE